MVPPSVPRSRARPASGAIHLECIVLPCTDLYCSTQCPVMRAAALPITPAASPLAYHDQTSGSLAPPGSRGRDSLHPHPTTRANSTTRLEMISAVSTDATQARDGYASTHATDTEGRVERGRAGTKSVGIVAPPPRPGRRQGGRRGTLRCRRRCRRLVARRLPTGTCGGSGCRLVLGAFLRAPAP